MFPNLFLSSFNDDRYSTNPYRWPYGCAHYPGLGTHSVDDHRSDEAGSGGTDHDSIYTNGNVGGNVHVN